MKNESSVVSLYVSFKHENSSNPVLELHVRLPLLDQKFDVDST